MSTETSSRPHRASRWEDRFVRAVAKALRSRGWQARVEPYTGYGIAPDGDEDGWVRVLGRVMLSPRSHQQPGTETDPTALEEDAAPEPRSKKARTTARRGPEPLRAVRGWRSFFTAQLPDAPVEIVVDGVTHAATTDRGGYIDAVVPARLTTGWHDVRVRAVGGGPAARTPVRVLDAHETTGLVSDVDDTVMVTALPRPLTAIWNILVLNEDARKPVKGMADLYAEIEAANPDIPVFYLSTNAWNVAPALRRFFAYHRYPAGPLFLTDWGPTNTGWFRSGREHKRRALLRLAEEFPQVKWFLFGDDGQHDPMIYGDFVDSHPDQVRAIAIRQLTATEQVLAHGAPTPNTGSRTQARAAAGAVPVVGAPDGAGLSRELRKAGVLPATGPAGASPDTMAP
ncbi:phosphatase domain-containing protein [Sanguibacter sp. 25GB23B1]|uniref:App1 family protein n=1 Tax=unclassified Sanguibacter TaxID=2645534 RepID=UPI0032AF7188